MEEPPPSAPGVNQEAQNEHPGSAELKSKPKQGLFYRVRYHIVTVALIGILGYSLGGPLNYVSSTPNIFYFPAVVLCVLFTWIVMSSTHRLVVFLSPHPAVEAIAPLPKKEEQNACTIRATDFAAGEGYADGVTAGGIAWLSDDVPIRLVITTKEIGVRSLQLKVRVPHLVIRKIGKLGSIGELKATPTMQVDINTPARVSFRGRIADKDGKLGPVTTIEPTTEQITEAPIWDISLSDISPNSWVTLLVAARCSVPVPPGSHFEVMVKGAVEIPTTTGSTTQSIPLMTLGSTTE